MPITMTVPQMGESVVEGTIGAWRKKTGDAVARDEVVVEILTDKITVEVPSGYSGKLGKILVAEGDVVQVGQPLAILLREGETDKDLASADLSSAAAGHGATHHAASHGSASKSTATVAPPVATVTSSGRPRTSPAVRRKARELGIDLSRIAGSGPKGRVRSGDLERAGASGLAPAPVRPTLPSWQPSSQSVAGEPVERMPFAGVRKIIAQHMVHSRQTSAHVTTLDEVDMTRLVEFRNKHKDRILKQYGVKLTYMPFIIKAATAAL